jgi:hypothetical protein
MDGRRSDREHVRVAAIVGDFPTLFAAEALCESDQQTTFPVVRAKTM